MGRHLQKVVSWTVPLVFIGTLFYWPLGSALRLGLSDGADFENWDVVFFTLWQALISTILCLAFGLPSAYLLYRKRFFGVRFLRALVTVPFVLPTLVVAIALNQYRHWLSPIFVILLAHLFLNFSIVVRTVGSVWGNLDRNLEMASSLDGATPRQTIWQIVMPQLRPAIASAGALVFLYTVTSFGVILLLGAGEIRSIETEIYFSLTYFLDFKTAGALALVQTLITLATFVITKKLGSSDISIGDENNYSEKLTRRNLVTALPLAFFVILIFLFPVSQVVIRSLPGWQLLDANIWTAVSNSIRNLVISSFCAMAIGTFVAWLLQRSNRKWLEVLFLMPLGVSTVVLGFGYLISMSWLRSSWLVLPLVQAVIAMPLVVRMVQPALAGLGTELRQAAESAGANSWQIWWQIEAPLISAVLRSAAVFAALTSLGEFGAASLLSFGNQQTVPVLLYQLISRPGSSNFDAAMAVSTLLIAMVFVVSLATSLGRTERRFFSGVL